MLARAIGVALIASAASNAQEARAPEAPTFCRDVAPIVYARCSACHRPGEAAPFALLSYADVHKRRDQVLRMVERRRMPPWLPVPGFGEFEGERRLTESEIDVLRAWVASGAAEGDLADLPALPRWAPGWQLGEPDLVLELAEPFEVPASGADVFRNFVIPVPGDRTRYVRGFELRPGNPRVVHHAIVQVDATGACRARDARDPEPGFPGMSLGESEPPDGHFLGWTPGRVAREAPAGMAWRLVPGTDLVVQMHMTPRGKPERVQPRIGLFFTDEPPVRVPYAVVLYSEDIDIPAGDADHVVRDAMVLPTAVDVISVYPHAHYLARRMFAEATLPDGTRQPLLRIDDWDFDWQDEYRHARPLHLPAGTELRFECRFDNSEANPRNPHRPPQRVRFGQASSDEMATLTLQVLPADARGRALLDRARWEHTLAKKPYDWHAHNALAVSLLRGGDPAGARRHLEEALRLKPDWVDALCNLGTAQRALGDIDAAESCFTAALRADPDSPEAHQGMGAVLAARQRLPEAIAQLRRALELRPAFAEAHVDLANVLAFGGKTAEARAHYEAALRVQPDVPEVYNNIANTWFAEGKPDAAIAPFRRALQLRPDYFNARLNLGRALLAVGGKGEAVEHLRRAVELRPDDALARAELDRATRAKD
jgi:Flp pilus assembly protein TadD